jgi:DNA invertase Pin-like site-specific DNA recombinase
MSVKEALEGKKMRVYLRVSGEKQEGSLPDQQKTVLDALKGLGMRTKPEVYSEQASGTKKDRKELQRMLQDIRESEKDSVVIVRDFQRFTRDPVHYGALWDEFRDKGVRIVSINENMATGTAKEPDPQSDLIVPILISAGGSEVNIRKQQTSQGIERAVEKGILQGSTINFYRDEPLEPRQEIVRLLKAGINQTNVAKRIQKSTSFVRKSRATINEIRERGGDVLLQDYFDTINLVRDFMNEKNEDIRGGKATVRMKTVVRMISGYLNKPTIDGRKPTREELDEYYNNFNQYKAKPKR